MGPGMSANLVTSPTPPADLLFQVTLVPREKRKVTFVVFYLDLLYRFAFVINTVKFFKKSSSPLNVHLYPAHSLYLIQEPKVSGDFFCSCGQEPQHTKTVVESNDYHLTLGGKITTIV